jgi:hypothetical protein
MPTSEPRSWRRRAIVVAATVAVVTAAILSDILSLAFGQPDPDAGRGRIGRSTDDHAALP